MRTYLLRLPTSIFRQCILHAHRYCSKRTHSPLVSFSRSTTQIFPNYLTKLCGASLGIMRSPTLPTTETTRLLAECEEDRNYGDQTVLPSNPTSTLATTDTEIASPHQILPLALFTALAMGATAATTIFAYASLLCKDPTHCRETERNVYAGTVAAATCIANLCGLLLLGTLERLSRKNHKAGLLLWLSLRSMSVVMLLIGCRHSRASFAALLIYCFRGLRMPLKIS